MSDLPSYPQDAADREAVAQPPAGDSAYSSWGRRVGAYLLDSLVIFLPLVVLVGIFVAADIWVGVVIAYIASLVVPFVYFTVMHGGESGATYGKRWLGIRVVSGETGDSIGYGRAFGRYAITVVFSIFFIPLLLDYLWPLWDAKNQTLHDKLVGSVVVRA